MTPCPAEDAILEFLNARLPTERLPEMQEHLAGCRNCLSLVVALARSEPSTGLAADDASGMPSRFQVLRCLGAGGMGVVYEALDRTSHTEVAIKTLRSFSPHGLLRFKHEFRSLQGLHHPNLVRYGELFESAGRWFFTMERVQGQDFLRHVRPERGGFDEDRLRAQLAQLWQGLAALHGAGKVHRDLKPANVLVTPQGRLVLLDFGLVAEPDALGPSSESGLVGTVAYMAPEQAAAAAPGPAVDLYSAGVMLYQALTGKLPQSGSVLEVLQRRQEEDPPPPGMLVPGVPADLNDLCVALLRRDPAGRPTAAELLGRGPAGSGQTEPPPPAGPVFVGRQAELQGLHQAFADSRGGQAVTVLCQGESGIGKSALVSRFVRDLKGGNPKVVVLAGRCYERESVPYKAVDGVLDELSRFMRHLPEAEAAALSPRWAPLLCQVFPVLSRVPALREAPRPARDIVDPQERRERLFLAVREVLTRLSERVPLVLCIDDLQWADPDGVQLLCEVLREPDAPPLLLVCTRRPGYPEHGEAEFLQKARPIELPPLGIEEAVELASRLQAQAGGPVQAATPADARGLAEEAGGHPLFIAELVRRGLHAGGGPAEAQHLDQVLSARVQKLEPGERHLLTHLAVSGTPLPAEALGRALGVDPREVRERARRLRGSGLLRSIDASGEHVLELYHDRVREALLQGLPADEQRECHQHLAQALVDVPGADAEVLARHFQAAGQIDQAALHAQRAADQAMSALAFGRAAQLYLMALDLMPQRTDLRTRLGDALASDGRGPQAADAYLHAAAAAPPPEARLLRTRAADQLVRTGHLGPGLVALRAALEDVGIRLPRTSFWALVSLMVQRIRLWLSGLRPRLRDPATLSQEEIGRVDICYSAALVLSMFDLLRGADLHTRQLRYALRAGEPYRVARGFITEALMSSLRGVTGRRRSARILALVEDLAPGVDPRHSPQLAAGLAAGRGMLKFHGSQIVEARVHIDSAVDILRRQCQGVACELANLEVYQALCVAYLGEMTELDHLVGNLVRRARDRGDRHRITHLLHFTVMVALSRDDPGEAARLLMEAREAAQQPGIGYPPLFVFWAQVLLQLYQRQGQAAWHEAQALWPQVLSSGIRHTDHGYIGALELRARTMIAAAACETGTARKRLLRAAERSAQKIGSGKVPMNEALAELLRAGVAAVRGEREDAIRHYAGAAEGLSSAGAGLPAAAARRRQGERAGGAAGQSLVAEADAWMRAHGVKNPACMANTLAPG